MRVNWWKRQPAGLTEEFGPGSNKPSVNEIRPGLTWPGDTCFTEVNHRKCGRNHFLWLVVDTAGKKRERVNATRPSAPPAPSPRQLSFEWVRRPEDRKPNEQRRIDSIRAGSDELAIGFGLADEFADLLRKRSCGKLGIGW